jgi:hypothetical protein
MALHDISVSASRGKGNQGDNRWGGFGFWPIVPTQFHQHHPGPFQIDAAKNRGQGPWLLVILLIARHSN